MPTINNKDNSRTDQKSTINQPNEDPIKEEPNNLEQLKPADI